MKLEPITTNTIVTEAVAGTSPVTYADLTKSQKSQYAIFKQHYSDEQAVLDLVQLIGGKGGNSLSNVIEKLTYINHADYDTQKYQDALYDVFQNGEPYDFDDIIGNVSGVRMALRIPPYTSRFKINCEQDFLRLFLVEPLHVFTSYVDKDGVEKIKRTQIGYKPLFKIKPEEL